MTHTKSKYVAFVVLNWNGAEDTIQCLESLRQVRHKAKTIIVIDNGSNDNSVKQIRKWDKEAEVTLIESQTNLGYASGNNVGIQHALELGADFVLVLNNDTVVAPDALDRLLEAAERYPEDGIFGARLLLAERSEIVAFAQARWDPAKLIFVFPGKGFPQKSVPAGEVNTDYVCGAALFFRSSVARRIGLFDKRFFLVFEDSDWCFRARRAGIGCRMIPSARVYHKVAASFEGEASPLRVYFAARNRLLWAEKHLPRTAWLRLLLRALGSALPVISTRGSARADLIRRAFWAGRETVREISGQTGNWQRQARRKALMDYLLRRFGDCGAEVRSLNTTWIAARRANRRQQENPVHTEREPSSA